MKRFLLNIFMFAILVIVLLGVPQYLFDYEVHNNKTTWPYKLLNQVNKPDRFTTKLLVSGNSRGEHYLASTMEELFHGQVENISMRGYPFNYQYYLLLNNYLRQGTHPMYILQEVGPLCFFGNSPMPGFSFLPYINRPNTQFLFDQNPALTPYDKFLPIKYRGNVDKLINTWKELSKPVLPEIENPYNGLIGKYPFEHDNNIINAFSSFIHECDTLNIRLILAISPMHTDDGIPQFEWDGFYHILDSVTAGYDIPLLDYSRLFGNDTTFFMDPVHLKHYGCEVYTRQIMHDLDSLGLIKN